MEKHYDIAVVGAGSGTKIAHFAAKQGLKVAFIDKGPFGGTCVNRGCIPSKMLIYPCDLMTEIRQSRRLNIDVESSEIDPQALVERVETTVGSLAEKIEDHYRSIANVDVYRDEVSFISDKLLKAGNDIIAADKWFLAIGARPRVPNIPGLSNTPYLTSDGMLRLKRIPASMIIIGGGFVAAELGHYCSTLGVATTIVTRGMFVGKLDREIRNEFVKEYEKSRALYEYSQVNEVVYEQGSFRVNISDESGIAQTLQSEALLVATGARAWTDQIGVENTSIKLNDQGFIQVDEYLRTTAADTWAFGDCIGHALFRHMANFEGDYLKKAVSEKGQTEPIQYPPIPFAIFTHPQIGQTGMTEEEYRKENREILIGRAEYRKSDMGKARQSRTGVVKLIFDKQSLQLLSAHIVGDEAATMIHIPIAFIKMKAGLKDLIETVYIHPALPEIISSAAFDAYRTLSEEKQYALLS